MTTVYIDNAEVNLGKLIGEGGEAEVFISPGGVVKVYKQPTHSSFTGNDQAQKAAVVRLREIQAKLPAYPSKVPSHLMAPLKLAFDSKGPNRRIVGFQMQCVPDAITLRELSDRELREQSGITQEQIVQVFAHLHDTVSQTHDAGLVIADFNPMNALVTKAVQEAWLIDADAMQFGQFEATSYTPKYVDPLVCKPGEKTQIKVKPHTVETDWYAFAMIFWECLLYVHPYGGVFKPADAKQRCGIDERPLRRISVLHGDVKYPVAGIPFNTLPDVIVDWYKQLLEKDVRQPFPKHFLTDIRFNQASAYMKVSTDPAVVAHVSNANASATRVFDVVAPGVIVQVAYQNGKLHYIYHKDGKYWREGDVALLGSPLDGDLKFRIHGASTAVGKRGHTRANVLPEKRQVSVDTFRGAYPVFDSNGSDLIYTAGGRIYNGASSTAFDIDETLPDQTSLFAGPKFGFGFYTAQDFRRAFVFDYKRAGKLDVDIKAIKGSLIDAACYFSDNRLWLFVTSQESGRIVNRCSLITSDGRILATAEDFDGADNWLGSLKGKSAFAAGGTELLASATEDGIVLIQQNGAQLAVCKTFAGTQGMVSPTDNLIFSPHGLYVWNTREIRLVKSK